MRLHAFFIAAALALMAPSGGLAVPPDVEAKAEELFRQARASMAVKDYQKALDLLKKSQALDVQTGKLANIAICEMNLGMVASAQAHFQETLQQLPAGDSRVEPVRKYMGDLAPRLPYVRIDLTASAPAGARVTLDGKPVDPRKLGVDMPVDPGKHQVVVTAAGRTAGRYEVTAEEGKLTTLPVEPGAALSPPASRSPAPTIVLGALGVLGFGAGVGFAAAREGKRSDAVKVGQGLPDNACHLGGSVTNAATCTYLRDTTAAGDRFGTFAWVGFVTGGLAVAGTLTYALWPAPKNGTAPTATLTWAPVLGGHERGILLSGSF